MEILKEVSLFVACGTATIFLPECPVTFVFEIRRNFEKDEKNRNVKILKDVLLFVASGTATIWQPESPLPFVF